MIQISILIPTISARLRILQKHEPSVMSVLLSNDHVDLSIQLTAQKNTQVDCLCLDAVRGGRACYKFNCPRNMETLSIDCNTSRMAKILREGRNQTFKAQYIYLQMIHFA